MNARQKYLIDEWFIEWSADPPIYGRATQFLIALLDNKPDRAWDFILSLVENSSSDKVIWNIAAGPLEDLLCDYGPIFIDRVEEVATKDQRFRKCLTGVWGSNRMDPSVYSRMRRAADMANQ
jgi:hypothetical protein